jgi:hypothetical protein
MRKSLYTPTYQSWQAMKQRCYSKKHQHYPNYGGRGITVCARWHTYSLFLADMGARPEGMSLDRKRNAEGYTKDNCRWATRTEQNRNSSQNRNINYRGETKCLAEWCQLLGLNYANSYYRLFISNWSVQDAFK